MSFSVAWHPAALWLFYRLPRHSAEIVDRAVLRFAATGEGDLGWSPPYHRLRAGLFDVAITIDVPEQRITVIHIRRRPA